MMLLKAAGDKKVKFELREFARFIVTKTSTNCSKRSVSASTVCLFKCHPTFSWKSSTWTVQEQLHQFFNRKLKLLNVKNMCERSSLWSLMLALINTTTYWLKYNMQSHSGQMEREKRRGNLTAWHTLVTLFSKLTEKLQVCHLEGLSSYWACRHPV